MSEVRNPKRRVNWDNPDARRRYKRDWQRRDRKRKRMQLRRSTGRQIWDADAKRAKRQNFIIACCREYVRNEQRAQYVHFVEQALQLFPLERAMDTKTAKQILAGPLRFGDPQQIAAKNFINSVTRCKELVTQCDECNGRGTFGGEEICECIAGQPEGAIKEFLKGRKAK